MKLTSIVVTSTTKSIPAKLVGKGTWAEMTLPAHVGHRYLITMKYTDGNVLEYHTNDEGEGLFGYDHEGTEYQRAGTSQFSVNDSTAANAKRWFRSMYKDLLEESGASISFEFDFK